MQPQAHLIHNYTSSKFPMQVSLQVGRESMALNKQPQQRLCMADMPPRTPNPHPRTFKMQNPTSEAR
ncbi:hypothetical protein ACO22_04902 [Paracoccidioides brasiliensis]|uniref:Uncharacterized protein n=1 Tax=Paracoccidioides brasiliensis TaxID=121759 RepID=A0A1D2JBZ1_PARBR|nr:hypothetical protein ACO22_04902 [Paracoccidioides brasiliensis]